MYYLSLPPYFRTLLCMPRIVKLRLEHIQRDFLWGGKALERKSHLVKWTIVCLDKRKGGLSIRCLVLNRPFYANGVDVLNQKEKLY